MYLSQEWDFWGGFHKCAYNSGIPSLFKSSDASFENVKNKIIYLLSYFQIKIVSSQIFQVSFKLWI